MISTAPNPTDTRPWAKPQAHPRTQVEILLQRMLSEKAERAFLFDLLRGTNAFKQQPTPPDFGAQLLARLLEIDPLGVGSMWAEAMAAEHAARIENKQ